MSNIQDYVHTSQPQGALLQPWPGLFARNLLTRSSKHLRT